MIAGARQSGKIRLEQNTLVVETPAAGEISVANRSEIWKSETGSLNCGE